MIYIALNAAPIAIATLAGLSFGAVYYRLARGPGVTSLNSVLPVAAIAEFWLTAILAGALILAPSKAGAWTMALGSAVVIWVGFIVPALIVTHRLRGLPMRAAVIDCGHWLGAMLVQAVVLKSVGLTAPAG